MTDSDDTPPTAGRSGGFIPLSVLLATGLGVGLLRPAPGTWGSLAALPIAWAVGQVSPVWLQAALIAGFCLISIPIATIAGRKLGRGKDPGCIVIDEFAGILITFFLVPITSIDVVVVGFLLFRVFDIVKLPPARQLERLPDGLGVMADDCAAAVYANVLLHLFVRYAFPLLAF